MSPILFCVILLCLALGGGTAHAAHPLATDDTATQGSGGWQLELSGEVSREKTRQNGNVVRQHTAELATTLSAGIGNELDLVLSFPWQWQQVRGNGASTLHVDGAGDTTLELKWRCFQAEGFSLAVKPGVTIPTGDESRGLGTGKPGYGVTLVASQEWPGTALLCNLGYRHDAFRLASDRQQQRNDIWSASLAVVQCWTPAVKLVAEAGLESNPRRGFHTPPAFATTGLIYALGENLDLDVGVRLGLSRPATDRTLLAGIAWRF